LGLYSPTTRGADFSRGAAALGERTFPRRIGRRTGLQTRREQKMSKRTVLTALLIAALPTAATAKNTQFWNLTADTITSLQLSPAGKNDWGQNQTIHDSDGSVDHDERLRITSAASGVYDVKFADRSGRTCIVENVEIKEGSIFAIEEKDLKNCSK
jgi:hypothetical protein